VRFKSKIVSLLVLASFLISLVPSGAVAVAATTPSYFESIKMERDESIDVGNFVNDLNKEVLELYNIDLKQRKLEFKTSNNLGLPAKLYQVYYIDPKTKTKEFYGYTLAYGNPYGNDKNDKKTVAYADGTKETVYRYLGKTLLATNDPEDGFTNISFPYDSYSGWTFPGLEKSKSFIGYPWVGSVEKVGKRLNPMFNEVFYNNETALTKIKQQIVLGLILVHPDLVSKNIGPDGKIPEDDIKALEAIPWEKYVHIYQPPTYSAWGMGVIWHKGKSDGKIWYKTIPIAPYQLVESKYGIITLGFLDDGKVGTIDILESVIIKY